MEKTFEVTIEQKHNFSVQDINDLVCSALEGGINYWCFKARIKRDAEKNYVGVAIEDREKVQYASDVVGYGGTLVLWNSEPDDDGTENTPIEYKRTWELTLDKMLEGIKKHCTKRGIVLENLLDNHDASDADCIVQYAIFGDIIFG